MVFQYPRKRKNSIIRRHLGRFTYGCLALSVDLLYRHSASAAVMCHPLHVAILISDYMLTLTYLIFAILFIPSSAGLCRSVGRFSRPTTLSTCSLRNSLRWNCSKINEPISFKNKSKRGNFVSFLLENICIYLFFKNLLPTTNEMNSPRKKIF